MNFPFFLTKIVAWECMIKKNLDILCFITPQSWRNTLITVESHFRKLEETARKHRKMSKTVKIDREAMTSFLQVELTKN